MTEEWRDIAGYEQRYQASNLGRIRSLMGKRGARRNVPLVMSPKTDRKGRLRLLLYIDGDRREWQVHQLVLMAFVGPAPFGMECLHRNGDHTDNTPGNLRWGTRKENVADSIAHGTFSPLTRSGSRHPLAKLSVEDVRCIRAEPYFPGVRRMLSAAFAVSPGQIRDIRNGKNWGKIPQLL